MNVPRATYRVQLRPGFGFAEAQEVAGYLARLGVSHVYCSPITQAAPGSEHGYDVADPTRISDDLGGPLAWAAMVEELRRHGLGLVLDLVPNHMSVATPLNRWWIDVLRFGRASPHAEFFDIEWESHHAEGQVLLPILGDHPGEVIARGELKLVAEEGQLRVRYFDHVAPLGPGSVARLLRDAGSELRPVAELHERLAQAERIDAQQRDAADAALAEALASPARTEQIAKALRRAEEPDKLPALLREQAWRFTFWREEERARNYRRFFDIDQLAAVRVEREEVFDHVHALPLAAVESGAADGLRIDHPDGLWDPEGYFQRLRERAPEAWIVAEKILEPGEHARREWPVDGLTGYGFLATVSGVLTDAAGAEPLQEAWEAFCGDAQEWAQLVHDCKRQVAQSGLAAELDRVARALDRCAVAAGRARGAGAVAGGPDARGPALAQREAVEEIGCWLGVYRTYLRPGLAPEAKLRQEDLQRVLEACAAASRRRPDLAAEIDEARSAMLTELSDRPDDAAAEFTLRFQQVSGVMMAKGVEDTAFYRNLRLVALNEVGGSPAHFGLALDDFHDAMHERRDHWPRGMLASSTHDTKRSEDVRARLLVLAELSGAWREQSQRWRGLAAALRRDISPEVHPSDEYLLYQTMVGAWPIEQSRTVAYMQKAVREGKLRSNWTDPDAAYEQALGRFIECVYRSEELLGAIAAFAGRLLGPGRSNSLAQALLKLTCPGAPDIYQGCELWDLSLVDPDNRRPVDFALRIRLLDELEAMDPAQIWQRMDEGLPKLWLIRQALDLRRRRPEMIAGEASYTAISAVGEQRDCCIAFMRDEGVISLASRFPMRLAEAGGWGDTMIELPAGRWVDVLSGQQWERGNRNVGDMLRMAPVALLERL